MKTAPKVENNKTSDSVDVHVSTHIKKAPVNLTYEVLIVENVNK